MLGAFYGAPRERERPVGLLAGPGAIPRDGVVGDSDWRRELFGTFSLATDQGSAWVEFVVDTFGHHLQQNRPLGEHGPGRGYKNQLEDGRANGVGAFFGWRGPYLDAFTPDPWGNRYMANTFALYRPGDLDDNDLFSSAVVCYSTGPDLGVDTVFNQPMNDADGDGVFGWVTGGDDLAVVLSAAGPF